MVLVSLPAKAWRLARRAEITFFFMALIAFGAAVHGCFLHRTHGLWCCCLHGTLHGCFLHRPHGLWCCCCLHGTLHGCFLHHPHGLWC